MKRQQSPTLSFPKPPGFPEPQGNTDWSCVLLQAPGQRSYSRKGLTVASSNLQEETKESP